jgi:hypothetical protein
MDGVEPADGADVEVPERIALDELERVMGLRRDVYADHVETRAVVTHRTATGPTEQV